MAKVLITLTKSTVRATERQIRVAQALGLHKLGQSVLHDDNPAIRGMAAKIPHLVTVSPVTAADVEGSDQIARDGQEEKQV